MHKLTKITILAFVIITIISYSASFATDAELERPRVLVLRSLDNIRYDMRNIMLGFQMALGTQEVQMDVVDVHVNYFDDSEYAQGIESMISSMVENGGDYDLLILVREPAVRYALQLETSFAKTPVIFGMVENEDLAELVHKKFAAVQVDEPVLLRENILLAGTIRDELDNVIVISDAALEGSNIEKALNEQIAIFENSMSISVMDSEEIMSSKVDLSELDMSNTMIYYLSEHHSANVLGGLKVDDSIVLTPWTSLIGNEIDGGRVLDSKAYGEIIGENALMILEGQIPSELESKSVGSKYVFDYQSVYSKNLDLEWIENEVVFLSGDAVAETNNILTVLVILLLFAVVILVVLMIQHYLTHHKKNVVTPRSFAEEIVHNVDTAISIKNEDREYIHINEKFKSLFNITDDAVGKTDAQIFPAQFAIELKSIDDRATFGSDDYDKKIIYNHMESGALYLEFKVKKVKDSGGRVHLVSYIGDLTEQKKHEKTLAELNKLLEQQVRDRTGELIQAEKMAILGTLVAGVSHEISTPIGVSITASTFLSDQTNHLKKQFESGALKKSDMVSFLELLDETGEILFNNLNNAAEMITNFKKVAVDQASEEIREFNLKDYSRGVVMNLKPKFKHTKHKIHVLGDENLMMYSYPGAVNQILTNLILNSLIHGFENKEDGEIRITIQERTDLMGVRIEYTDDGQGISKDSVAKIFDPFYTTKRGKGGSGLGMNIVRNLVEKTLNGRIKVYSNVGEGVRFVLDFPQRINVYESQSSSDS